MFWRKPARQLPGRPAEQPAGLTSTLTCTEPNPQSACSIQCVPSACSKRALICRFPCHQHQGRVARSGLGQEKDPHFLSSPNPPRNGSDPLADASKWCGWVWERVSFSFLKKRPQGANPGVWSPGRQEHPLSCCGPERAPDLCQRSGHECSRKSCLRDTNP